MIDPSIFEDLQAKIDEESEVRDVSWRLPTLCGAPHKLTLLSTKGAPGYCADTRTAW
jgi:hypothetical protein